MRPGVPTLRAARCWAASRSLHSARGWAAGRSTLRALAVGLLVDGPARTAVAAVGEREEPMPVVTASASVATPTCAVTVVPTCALIACQIGGNKAVSGQAFKSGQALSHAIRNPQSRAMAGTSGRRLSGSGEGGVSDLQDRRSKGEVRRRSKRSVACPLQATSSMARRRRHQHGGRGSGARERTSPSRLRWRPVFLATSLLALLLCSSAARARRRGIPPAGGGCAGTGRDGR